MSIANSRSRKARPTHPGEMLREDFLPDYGLTVSNLAKALRVSSQTLHELLRERCAVTRTWRCASSATVLSFG